jgi:hypothetical protein
MKLRFVSDGTGDGTHIEDANGNRLKGLKSFAIYGDAKGIEATLRFTDPDIEIIAPNALLNMPKAYRAEFRDKIAAVDAAREIQVPELVANQE